MTSRKVGYLIEFKTSLFNIDEDLIQDYLNQSCKESIKGNLWQQQGYGKGDNKSPVQTSTGRGADPVNLKTGQITRAQVKRFKDDFIGFIQRVIKSKEGILIS